MPSEPSRDWNNGRALLSALALLIEAVFGEEYPRIEGDFSLFITVTGGPL
jgi:hypothetical protein